MDQNYTFEGHKFHVGGWYGPNPYGLYFKPASTLSHRDVNVNSTKCVLCNIEVESPIIGCQFVHEVFFWIFKWCGNPIQRFSKVEDFINYAAKWGQYRKKRKVFLVITISLFVISFSVCFLPSCLVAILIKFCRFQNKRKTNLDL